MAQEFELGVLVATAAVDAKMKEDKVFKAFVYRSLARYIDCDWGDTCAEDKKSNDKALNDGERILAVYTDKKSGVTIWIITEWDRSVTTILFPEDY